VAVGRTFAAWLAAYLALRLVAPQVAVGPPVFGAIVAALAFMLVSLALIVAGARMELRPGQRAVVASAALAVWVSLLLLRSKNPVAGLIADAALITAATHFGVLLSSVIREPKLLLPVALCAGLVDIWGVNFGGPVAKALESKQAAKVLNAATAKVPAFGSARIEKGERPPPPILIGFGDFFFLGVFFACLARFSMNLAASFWLTAACIVAALMVLPLLPFNLPGLPFMAVGVILPNVGHFQFTREEKFALLWAGAILGASLMSAVWMTHAAPVGR